MSDAQWPTLPMPSEPPAGDAREPSNAQYTVLVEQLVPRGGMVLAGSVSEQSWIDLDQARAEAEGTAWSFRPRHPMSEQARTVYRLRTDEYLSVVEGATTTFQFRTLVAEQLGRRTA